MDVTKLIYAIIAITIGIIITTTVLIPTVSNLPETITSEYGTLLGVVVTLTIIAIVMMAVRLMANRD